MPKRLHVSTWLAITLIAALVTSLAFHAAGWFFEPAGPHVVLVQQDGPPERPTLLLDFDRAMVLPDRVGTTLGPDAVRLEPPVGTWARFLTARRLEVRPTADLPPFTRCRVVFGRAFGDLEGRSVDEASGQDLSFASRSLGFLRAPTAVVDERGRAVGGLELTGPVRADDLRRHLVLADPDGRPVRYELEGAQRTWRVVLGRIPDKTLTLSLGAGLQTSSGPEGVAEDIRRTLAWSRSLRITRHTVSGRHPDGVVSLRFSHALARQDVAAFVSVVPAVEGLEVERKGAELHLTGAFPPRRTVVVRIRSGLAAVGDVTLQHDLERAVAIPKPQPRLAFAQGGQTLSSAARPEIEIKGINVPAVDVTLYEIFPNNVVPLALRWTNAPRLANRGIETRIPIGAPLDETWTRTLDLAKLLGRAPRGVFCVEIRDPARYWTRDARLLQVTDLAPVVRIRDDGVVVFVTRLSDGTPVANADVRVFDRKNQPCAQGTTDEQGILVATHPAGEPFVVTVKTGDDHAWVDLRAHAVAHAPRDVEGAAPVDGLEAFAFADRGAVRPGETAHVGVVVRTSAGTAPPADLPVTLVLLGPDRRVVRRLERRLDIHGMAAADLAFPLESRTGAHRVDVLAPGGKQPIGTCAFRVETIVPDRIEPHIELPDADLVAGKAVSMTLFARLLTGEPAPDRAATLTVRYRPLKDAGEGGFTFGDAEDGVSSFTGFESSFRLDEHGRATQGVLLPDLQAKGVPLEATFALEVVDVSGRAAFARQVRRLEPAGPRLGLAAPSGDSFALPVALKGAASVEGEAVLERIAWDGGWTVEHGRTVWRANERAVPLKRVPLKVAGARGTITFPDPGDGRFRVRVTAKDCAPAAIRFERWDGMVSAASKEAGTPRLDLRLTREHAVPGTTARLRLDAPFAGRGLLTVEGVGALEARSIEIPEGPSEIEVDLPNADGPDAYVTLTLVRGAAKAGERHARMLGAARIGLRRPERHLDVALDVLPEVLPGTTATVRVETSRPSTVRVHLVDEGVLRLTGHATPSPLAFFEAPRRLKTQLADVYASLLERMRFGSDDAEPGGGGGLLAQRLDPTAQKTIETIALASALVRCDGEEATELSFPIPDWEGRLRVFAVAAGEIGTGSAEAPLVVKAPIGLQVHVPRAVAPGDVFDVTVNARGDGVALDVTLDGLERLNTGLPVRVRAIDRPGLASVTVRAQDAHGNVTQRKAALSIRPPAPFTTRHVVRRVAAGEVVEEDLPGRWLGGTRRARIVVGRPGGIELLPALERLLEYPHGCLEQTISKGFPILAWSELARLAHAEAVRPADTVSAVVDRLQLMRTSSGGLALWPGGDQPYPFGSAYAAHFLVEAKALDRQVPDELIEPLLDWLEERLRSGRADPYTARVLALAGRTVVSYLDALERKAETAEERADLAAAWLLAGANDRADRLLAEVGDPWAVPREKGGRLSSPIRSASTVLLALVEARPDDRRIAELELRLTAAAREAAANTTQENAAALLALAKSYASGRARETPTRGVLYAAGGAHRFEGHEPLVVEVGETDAWRFRLEANGPTTLVMRLDGVPLDLDNEPDVRRGLEVTRRIVTEDGVLKQGCVYEVVIEGFVPAGSENVLVTDVLPGGLEIEAARNQGGTLTPDRVEPRDDRVLFFRTAAISGRFTQTYRVRAVTPGTFRLPPVQVELLYAPELMARSKGGGTLEIRR